MPSSPLTLVDFEIDPASIVVGEEATVVVLVSGGQPPYEYAFAGLPTACSRGSDEVLLCSPGSAGTYRVTLNASDQVGAFVLGNASLVVGTAPTGTRTSVSGWSSPTVVGAVIAAGAAGLVAGVAIGLRGRRPPTRRSSSPINPGR